MELLVGLLILLFVCAGSGAVSRGVKRSRDEFSIAANVDGTYSVVDLKSGAELYTGELFECEAYLNEYIKG